MFEGLKTTKNLLAFSGGVDSTALFFMLLENKIPFDIAIVNYNIREQSSKEVEYAVFLAEQCNKKIYIKSISDIQPSNFESVARNIRYEFFEKIIFEFNYEVLLTAHQLNDRFEWFLMQLSRGAGVTTMLGMEKFTKKNGYQICRPLLQTTKQELLNYLKSNEIKYFIDETNNDEKYKRNYFRKTYSEKFLEEFSDGIKKSFAYLERDKKSLQNQIKKIIQIEELSVFAVPNDDSIIVSCADAELKKRGILLSSETKKEILKQKQITISNLFCVAISDSHLWIAPKTSIVMDKKFKECARRAKIPQNIRPYLKKILGECNEIQKLFASDHFGGDLPLDK